VFSELFANNVFVKLLRGDSARYDLIVSMVGVKLGERLLVISGGDGALVAAIGSKTGLTGTLAAIEADKAVATRVAEQATKAGVLADVYAAPELKAPFDPDSFDIVVIPFPPDDDASLASRAAEAFRVLRNGGRCAVIVRAARNQPSGETEGQTAPIVALLQQQGFRAARLLAERSGLVFYEGVRK
jgi:SAM-dependent methyltransferase